ncbi:MAG: hypothetical protein H6673_02935 [Anaerolineales bacterium]|nr:hypothetical protein [Anaerolineales bacterium]
MVPPRAIQVLGAGITCETLEDGCVTIFTLTDMTRITVDIWVDACDTLMRTAVDTHTPVRIIQDLSHPNVTQTPYSQERGQALQDAYPELQGRIAVILPNNHASHRIRLFFKRQNNRYRQRDVFFTREAALEWLNEVME